ncbi:MAG: hypothetical protein J7484_11095 [Microbacterium sp.]|nr:hypothetical protein [Microbacterium sp.]
MNTTLHRSTTHPPDTADRKVLELPDPGDLRELRLADRLTFRFGLWLLGRAQRPRRQPSLAPLEDPLRRRERTLSPAESAALLHYQLHHQLR